MGGSNRLSQAHQHDRRWYHDLGLARRCNGGLIRGRRSSSTGGPGN